MDYLSADVESSHAMIRMDPADIRFPGERFNVIFRAGIPWGSDTDGSAYREMYRSLKSGAGYAVFVMPPDGPGRPAVEGLSETGFHVEPVKLYDDLVHDMARFLGIREQVMIEAQKR